MARKKTTTLYFTEEANITDEQLAEMERLVGARQRNASMIDSEAPLEKADFVAGPAVPEAYAAKYPAAVPMQVADDEEEETVDANEMTAADIKAALDEAGVDYPKSAKKAELVALYEEHLGE